MEPIDLELARKFLIELLPAHAQVPVSDIVKHLAASPAECLNRGMAFNAAHYFNRPVALQADDPVSVAAVNGICMGFALAYCLQYPDIKQSMEGYILQCGKRRGENVVQFLHKKGIK